MSVLFVLFSVYIQHSFPFAFYKDSAISSASDNRRARFARRVIGGAWVWRERRAVYWTHPCEIAARWQERQSPGRVPYQRPLPTPPSCVSSERAGEEGEWSRYPLARLACQVRSRVANKDCSSECKCALSLLHQLTPLPSSSPTPAHHHQQSPATLGTSSTPRLHWTHRTLGPRVLDQADSPLAFSSPVVGGGCRRSWCRGYVGTGRKRNRPHISQQWFYAVWEPLLGD